MVIEIKNIEDANIKGVRAVSTKEVVAYKENYFEWTAFPMVGEYNSVKMMMGLLQGWHHTPIFSEVEYHEDNEMFYFIEGTALMLFVDIADGIADMKTAQVVRIPEGTELEIEKGKAHFVPVAEGTSFKALVVSPVQDAPRIRLHEIITA